MTTAQPNQVEHDVICHMDIGLEQAAGRSDYDGRTYYFCANSCKEQFDADPEAALKAEDAHNHSVKPATSMGAAIE
jgi:YHS domain-containing protein